MINKISILSIPVEDQARAKAFYMDVLAFELVADDPMGPDQRWVQLRPPAGETSISLVTWFDEMPPGSVQGLVLETDDVRADREVLAGRGLDITLVDNAPWGEFATFSDPDGNGWVLQETRSR
jgi:catechol 2,3-dioxygenase-like lactoylglutathione lyase family enzyme